MSGLPTPAVTSSALSRETVIFHSGGWYSYLQYDEETDRPSLDRGLLLRVWSYGRPYKGALLGVLATVFVISALTVVPPVITRELVDVALPEGDLGLLTLLGAGMVAVPLINALVGLAQRYWSSRAGEGIIFDLRRELYEHLQSMSLRFFTATKTGELISRLNSDVVGAQQAITGTFVSILSNVVSVVVILVVMVQADPLLTVLAVAALPLFILPARRVGKLLRKVTERQMEHNAGMSSILQETFNVSGALLVKLFNRGRTESDRFSGEAAAVRDLGVRRAMIGRWFFAGLGLVSAVGTAVVWWVGGYLVITEPDRVTIGTLVMFAGLLGQLYGPLSAISNSRVEFATSLVSFERVFEILDLSTDLPEAEDAKDLTDVRGRVEFDHVYFTYRTDDPQGLEAVRRYRRPVAPGDEAPQGMASTREWALEDVTFTAEPGQLVALVGPSGAGKTTISYLLPRLYDVTRGEVRVDGHDVRSLTLGSLSDAIGVVTQETYLFHDTIAANLRYARPDATIDQIEAAAEAANIAEFISSLEHGYETVVGERGYRLSGGEKQRIAIARVILKDPKILVLDEATSHLDTRSEALIQEALERLLVDRTSLVIAHRLSTVQRADRILVIDEGRLVESGTHEELVAAGGLYATLHRTQFRGAAAR
ncbi:MAG: ABC transporter ATP-binding protein [Acidimicrobiia bacterium]|nr:ABC transporter ATP-binding protein [Acidimicrobiia bacterium]